jgi:hypothetical protein
LNQLKSRPGGGRSLAVAGIAPGATALVIGVGYHVIYAVLHLAAT